MKSGSDGVSHQDARAFAVNEGWVGAGWGLSETGGIEDGSTDFTTYLSAASKVFENVPSLIKAARAIHDEMDVGDYCWMYDTAAGDYWCCVVTGPFAYRQGNDFDRFDLHLIRPCRWVRVGTADAVPGAIRRAFAGPFGTISRLVTGENAIIEASELALDLRSGVGDGDFFDLATPEDLEDIVALYLQHKGWMIYPSTSKSSMATYEFILVDRHGRRAGVQVKRGNDSSLALTVAEDLDIFFVLMANVNATVVADSNRITSLSRTEIAEFARSNWHLLPRRLQTRWDLTVSQ